MMKRIAVFALAGCAALAVHGSTWSFDYGEPGHETEWAAVSNAMEQVVETWNTYATYNTHFNVKYHSGVPTAQSDYGGEITFGGSINYRVGMHETSHYLGTGTIYEWTSMNHFYTAPSGRAWNGTYAMNLRRAYAGPSERMGGDSQHYWPYGANYDSEGVDEARMVGIIGAYRRDMGLSDETIGIASGTYRLCNRVSTLTLDSLGASVSGAQVGQDVAQTSVNDQLWDVTFQVGTSYFTIENVGNGLYLDSMNGTNGAVVGMTTLSSTPTDSQLWSIEQTDSSYFKIVNKANGRGLDTFGDTAAGAGMRQYDASGNGSWNMQWTFRHSYAQTVPELGVVSQGRPVSCSSIDGAFYPEKGNNGVSEPVDCSDRWTASDGSYPQWWHVDLGVEQPVTRVEVDWFPGGVFRYEVQVSSDGSSWTTVSDRTDNNQAGTTVDNLTDVFARYVRINITGTSGWGWAAFMECRVYNEAEASQLLSMNRPCSASSEQIGNLSVNANDVDSTYTRWCANASTYPAWWQVDLGELQSVTRVLINWFDDGERNYQYRIEGSTNNVDFFTMVDRTANTTPSSTADTFEGEARYVRITVTGSSAGWPSFYDAQVYSLQADVEMPPPAPTGLSILPTDSAINLDWADSSADDLAGYTVYRSTTSGSGYSAVASNLLSSVYSDSAVSGGTTYYYVVTATDSNAYESSYSAQVSGSLDPTQEFWDFENSSYTGGAPANDLWFTDTSRGDALGANGTIGSGGTLGRGWDQASGPQFDSDVVSPGGGSFAMDTVDNSGDMYVTEGALHNWSVSSWTVELQVNIDTIDGNETLIGRDGSSYGASASDFYFQVLGSGILRLKYRTSDGTELTVDGSTVLQTGSWYGLASVCDTAAGTVTLYVDDGSGYAQDGQAIGLTGDLGIKSSGISWTFGRGWWNGGFVDFMDAHFDNIRFSNRALEPAELIALYSAPAAPGGLVCAGTNEQVSLLWPAVSGASAYNVRRALQSGGPYAVVDSTSGTSSFDSGLTNGVTYYYVVTAENPAGESDASVEVSVVPSAAVGPGEYAFAGSLIVDDVYVHLSISNSVPGHTYQVLVTDNLEMPDWQPVGSVAIGDGSNLQFEIPDVGSGDSRFYKLDVQRQ